MKLSELRENPNNPSKATEEELERLAGKLKRVPLGLTAMRIAYITDDPEGGKMVISGNKRLRVLKRAYGEDGECPDDWFQDVSYMTEEQRREFIINSNVNEGEWDLDKLLESYDVGYLDDLGLQDITSMIPSDVNLDDYFQPKEEKPKMVICEYCGKEFALED